MVNRIEAPAPEMPARLVCGDALRLEFVALAADYPAASGYSAKIILTPAAGGTALQVSATGGALSWLLTLTSFATAALVAGAYRWALVVTKASDRVTVDQGTIDLLPDPTAANVDSRTHARRVLDAIEAAIEGRASRTDLETTFADGRSIKQMPHAELLRMRDAYAGKVAAETRRARGVGPRRVLMRF